MALNIPSERIKGGINFSPANGEYKKLSLLIHKYILPAMVSKMFGTFMAMHVTSGCKKKSDFTSGF